MYQQLRTELIAKLAWMDAETLAPMISALDSIANNYNITPVTTDITIYQPGLPQSAKVYIVTRSIEGVSQKTLHLYQTLLTKFFNTVRKPQEQITVNDIRVWLFAYESTRAIGKRTLELYRTILNGYFEWACAEGWVQKNPVAPIKPIRYPKKQRKSMDQIELQYIRSACKSAQQLAIVELLYSTGCRVSQLSNMKKQDVDWDKCEVTVLGKGNKYRTCYLNAKALVALSEYMSSREDSDDHLIVSSRAPHTAIGKGGLQKIIRNISKRVEGKLTVPVTPHIFRHTTATQALQHGMPVQDVQRMLGHSNIGTTMVYAQVSDCDVKSMHVKCVV